MYLIDLKFILALIYFFQCQRLNPARGLQSRFKFQVPRSLSNLNSWADSFSFLLIYTAGSFSSYPLSATTLMAFTVHLQFMTVGGH